MRIGPENTKYKRCEQEYQSGISSVLSLNQTPMDRRELNHNALKPNQVCHSALTQCVMEKGQRERAERRTHENAAKQAQHANTLRIHTKEEHNQVHTERRIKTEEGVRRGTLARMLTCVAMLRDPRRSKKESRDGCSSDGMIASIQCHSFTLGIRKEVVGIDFAQL